MRSEFVSSGYPTGKKFCHRIRVKKIYTMMTTNIELKDDKATKSQAIHITQVQNRQRKSGSPKELSRLIQNVLEFKD